MDRKKIIEIVLVIIAFFGSAFVIYTGFFKQPAVPNPAISSLAGQGVDPNSILPFGNKMDFSPLSTTSIPPFQFDAIQYPVLEATSEVGILPQDLLK